VPEDPTRLSALELAARIRDRALGAEQAVEAAISRIEAVNPRIRALVVPRYDEARREARAADAALRAGAPLGPLHGVPVTVKECLDLAGTPSSFGLPSRASHRAERDEPHVARLRAAGAIVVGKTNASQLLLFMESDNPLYGRTDNPWDAARTPGGSSGGEGALLAAGGSALGLGTDIGGSVRVPAAFCGICSIKPTSGRCPDPGRSSAPYGQRAVVSQIGVLARTVADVSLGLEVIHGGRTPRDAGARPLDDPAAVELRSLRVGWFDDDGTFTPARAIARGVRLAAEALEAAGARVVRWTPPRIPEAACLYYAIMGADGFRGARRTRGKTPRDRRIALLERVGGLPRPALRLIARLARLSGRAKLGVLTEVGGLRDADEWFRLVEAQRDYRDELLAAMDTADRGPLDVLLGPASGLPAFRHGASAELVMAGTYTALYNLVGFPAGIVPVTRVAAGEEQATPRGRDVMERVAKTSENLSAGLPVAVQVAARPFRDHVALAAMAAIERSVRDRPDFPATPVPLDRIGSARLG
jgi:fatty acid amide hydrolase